MHVCAWLCPVVMLMPAGLWGQGVELSGGFVLGAPPRVPRVECPTWAEGWTAGTGADLPLVEGFKLLFEGRYSRISESGISSAGKSFGVALLIGVGKGVDLQGGLVQRRDEVHAAGDSFAQNRPWGRVAIRIPGLVFPLPGAIPVAVRPFGAENLRTFTRLEFSRALRDFGRGNEWEFSWSLGLRCSLGE